MIYHKEHTTSTNDDVRNGDFRHLDVVWAEHQSAGRGQRGHTWHSVANENLTFTLCLTPEFLPATEQFLLSEVVALSLVDTLAEYDMACRIKWTNDIYVGDNKVAGILIEHALAGDHLKRTIVGIGLNVNQRLFPADLPNPTSMAVTRGITFDREEVLRRILAHVERNYNLLAAGVTSDIETRYHDHLYRLDVPHTYATPSGELFVATLRGVRSTGHLSLEHADGAYREYAFKEVEFVVGSKKVEKNF